MTLPFQDLLKRYRTKGVLIDANLLLLFAVGTANVEFIKEFKRTSMFDADAYYLLREILAKFTVRYVTPNIMTEVSNFAGELWGERKLLVFAVIRETFSVLQEQYVPTGQAVHEREFPIYGLTDTTIIVLLKNDLLFLTTDGPLAGHCANLGINAINFTPLYFQTS